MVHFSPQGWLRLATGRIDADVLTARNTLTQRTFGPQCSGNTYLDVSGMKDGDCAGLILLQSDYGYVGVKKEGERCYIVMQSMDDGHLAERARVPLKQSGVYLKAECDFRQLADKARFYYSLDGDNWTAIGEPLQMRYKLTHFMGYRFGLFNHATRSFGGHADFDFFRIE
jgi:beta-xylosidase